MQANHPRIFFENPVQHAILTGNATKSNDSVVFQHIQCVVSSITHVSFKVLLEKPVIRFKWFIFPRTRARYVIKAQLNCWFHIIPQAKTTPPAQTCYHSIS